MDPDRVLAEGQRLEVFVGRFLRDDGAEQLRGRSIAAAEVHGGEVLLDACFDRTDAGSGRPGTYVGTVSIVDPRVARSDLPFTVTLAFPDRQPVLAVFVAMLPPATLYVWCLRGRFSSNGGLKLRYMQTWLFSRTAGTGFRGGVRAVLRDVLQSPDRGGDAPRTDE